MMSGTSDRSYGYIQHRTKHGTIYARHAWEGEQARGREPAVTGWEFLADPGGYVIGRAEASAEPYAVMAADGTALGLADHDNEAAELIAEHHHST